MSRLPYTPGPWQFDPEDESIYSGAGYLARAVCEIAYTDKDEEDESNARLIAAAPEMYELLRKAAFSGLVVQDEARELIAKLEDTDQ